MSEKLECIDEVKFTSNGELLLMRDFFNIYSWDVRNVVKPLVHKGTGSPLYIERLYNKAGLITVSLLSQFNTLKLTEKI